MGGVEPMRVIHVKEKEVGVGHEEQRSRTQGSQKELGGIKNLDEKGRNR